MKNLLFYTMVSLLLPNLLFAQESIEPKKFKMKMVQVDNDKEKSIDTSFTFTDEKEIEQFLKENGFKDFETLHEFDLDFDDDITLDDHKSYRIFFKHELDDDDMQKEMKWCKVESKMQKSDSDEKLLKLQNELALKVEELNKKDLSDSALKRISSELLNIANVLSELSSESSMQHVFVINEEEIDDDFHWSEDSNNSKHIEIIKIDKEPKSIEKHIRVKKEIHEEDSEKERISNALDVAFYPNPTTGSFTLEFSNVEAQNTSIKIYDNDRKVVYSEKLKNFKGKYSKEIELKDKSNGVYIVDIESGNNRVTKKLILKK